MRVLHVGYGFRPWHGGGLIEYTEDLMDMQAAQGYQVGYFFSGRHYPFIKGPWLRRWLRRGVNMYEVSNSFVPLGFAQSAKYPEVDLTEEYTERSFIKVLAEFRPNIVHIQQLFGLPSSLIEIIKLKRIPALMTLHDYFTLCPTLKLFDHNKSLCLRLNVGDTCKLCYSQEIRFYKYYIDATLYHERHQAWWKKALVRIYNKTSKLKCYLFRSQKFDENTRQEFTTNNSLAERFQTRRDTNIERLNQLDLLVAQSFRVSKIYQTLGVQESRITTIHSTVGHISNIKPKNMTGISFPINIAVMNVLSSPAKGVHLIVDALHKLREAELTSQFRLIVLGYGVLDDVKNELTQFDNIVYKGAYDVNELNELLEEVQVGIVPSVWEEVYGYVGIEFLAKGIPVIGNRVGGIVDYTIDGFTGWVNRTNTAVELVQIITDVVRSPDKILQLNRSILLNYHQILKSMNIHFKEIDKVYNQLIEAKKK